MTRCSSNLASPPASRCRSTRAPSYPPDMSDAEWAVTEPSLPGITRCRCTVRDYERLTAHHETIVYRAMIITMSRRLARQRHTARPHVT
jgi:hypothetical protein